MANLLNNCFSDAFTREGVSNVPEPATMKMNSVLEEVSITATEVKKKIQALRSEAAAGPDGIEPRILKALQNELAPVLVHIFKQTLVEGSVPADWKLANVTPIFIKVSKSVTGKYRPVSLTSVCCKLMESIMRDSITDHLECNKLIKRASMASPEEDLVPLTY